MKERNSTKSSTGSLTKRFLKFNKAFLFLVVLCASVSTALAASVNVTDAPYNAVGNAFNDNRTHIQAAIDHVEALGGGTVYFPSGLYHVSGTIYLKSNVRLQGMGSLYNCQIRLTNAGVPLFEVADGKSDVTFMDLTLYSWNGELYPRISPLEVGVIRTDNTTGISLKAGGTGISKIVIENVRIMRFTRGVSATSSIPDANIKDVKIRNYASDGNEYSLYTKTRGADGWDVQNMNVYPMYDKQKGIFLERSGKMSFLQLSCAGNIVPESPTFPYPGGQNPGVCAKLWDNGDTYFRQMHVEGPKLGFCVGSDCEPLSSGNMGENASLLTIESSATNGEFHRATNLVSINNRFWLDLPAPPRPYKFFGSGTNSWVMSCGDVWVKWDPYTHITDTTVKIPTDAFYGLTYGPYGCVNYYLSSVPPFAEDYTDDDERLTGEVNVTNYCATPVCAGDDTQAFINALAAATATGPPSAGYVPINRIYVPAGSYDVSATLELKGGETFVGEAGSTIRFTGRNSSLFKVVATTAVVRGITWRNLLLTTSFPTGNVGINMESTSTSVEGGASDFQIQNVDFDGFEAGIAVQPACMIPSSNAVCGNIAHANPMFDSVSVKDADFTNNKTGILIRSQNASNWNLENIRISNPNGKEGVRVDGIGHLSIRKLTCTGLGTDSACVTVQRQSGLSIDGLSANNVTNALVARWENGHTQFPFTLRNSNLLEGVYFQGRVYLNSVNNIYPAKLSRFSTSKEVKFGANQEGNSNNIAYGGLSDIFSCNDTFKDAPPALPQSNWAYLYNGTHPEVPAGYLPKPVRYCN